ncbi:hypothetical protein Q8A73_012996 [Channa argus]|nr:hypothetical protein Q8A73_012996 [Channa argus]
MGSNLTATQEKCYDPQDSTFTFVDREDEMDFLCEGFQSRRALMSCGHAVTPMSLTNWCRRLLKECLRKWKGPAPRSDRCGNPGCTNESLETLQNCPDINLKYVEGVTACPSIRACPTCGILLERDKKRCKNITCPRCKIKFCFVCLKLTEECLPTSDYYIQCASGVAPRQASLPVWQKK